MGANQSTSTDLSEYSEDAAQDGAGLSAEQIERILHNLTEDAPAFDGTGASRSGALGRSDGATRGKGKAAAPLPPAAATGNAGVGYDTGAGVGSFGGAVDDDVDGAGDGDEAGGPAPMLQPSQRPKQLGDDDVCEACVAAAPAVLCVKCAVLLCSACGDGHGRSFNHELQRMKGSVVLDESEVLAEHAEPVPEPASLTSLLSAFAGSPEVPLTGDSPRGVNADGSNRYISNADL